MIRLPPRWRRSPPMLDGDASRCVSATRRARRARQSASSIPTKRRVTPSCARSKSAGRKAVQRAACAGKRSAALRSFNIERFPQSGRNGSALGCADLPVIRVSAAFGRRHLRIRTLGRGIAGRRCAPFVYCRPALRVNAMLSSRLTATCFPLLSDDAAARS